MIKPAYLGILMKRILTIFLVMAHYEYVEKIDYMTKGVRENEMSFIKLILVWHLIFMICKLAEYSKFLKNERHKIVIYGLCGAVGIPGVIAILFTPILAWFNYEITKLDTSFWTLRYLMLLLYIVMNIFTSVFPHVYNFLFLISDGIILG